MVVILGPSGPLEGVDHLVVDETVGQHYSSSFPSAENVGIGCVWRCGEPEARGQETAEPGAGVLFEASCGDMVFLCRTHCTIGE